MVRRIQIEMEPVSYVFVATLCAVADAQRWPPLRLGNAAAFASHTHSAISATRFVQSWRRRSKTLFGEGGDGGGRLYVCVGVRFRYLCLGLDFFFLYDENVRGVHFHLHAQTRCFSLYTVSPDAFIVCITSKQ